MSLSKRQTKKRQMVRTGYAGVGIGVVILLYAITAAPSCSRSSAPSSS